MRLGAKAFTGELRDYLSKRVTRFCGDLLHPYVHIVVDCDGCSHEGSIGSDTRESNYSALPRILRQVLWSQKVISVSVTSTEIGRRGLITDLLITFSLRSGVLGLLFLLTQLLEFLQLSGGQNGSQFI